MPNISFTTTAANQAELTALLNLYADELDATGRYTATVAGSTLNLVPLAAPVRFLRISPAASAGSVADFCTFVGQNPPQDMVNAYARHAGDVGNPTQQFRAQLVERLADANRSFPDKLEVLQNALAQIHQNALPDVLRATEQYENHGA